MEGSDGSQQKLLNPLTKEGSGLPKFRSISLSQRKFTPEDLIAVTIQNSEKVCLNHIQSREMLKAKELKE